MPAYCLGFHAEYACAHSGACCTAPWPIPIEPSHVSRLRAYGLVPRTGSTHVRALDPPVHGMTLALGTGGDGACVFFDAGGGRLCRIHRDAGADLLPSSCRNFPRIALRDGRGLFVTLSHYCPTAGRLLLRAKDIRIVEAPDSLSLDGAIEGLDATAVLPPLLRPGMLADPEGYSRWEQEAIAVLNDRQLTARDAVAVIRAATGDTCEWRPGDDTLAGHASRAFARARQARSVGPADLSPLEHPTKAFMAAHLFGSWAAYQSGGLTAVVDAVEAALALVGTGHADEDSFMSAVRAADLRLRHT